MIQRLDLTQMSDLVSILKTGTRTSPVSSKADGMYGSNTLLQIFLRCTPLAFFFRFTFCAIDSVHLNVSISIQ